MSGIRGKDTAPEMFVRRGLHRIGYRFRLNNSDLPGRPDLKLTRYNAIIFVHGCYWHRHEGCRYATTPKSNADFWIAKLTRNAERDHEKEEQLRKMGWRVMVVWECALRKRNRERLKPIERLAGWLQSKQTQGVIPRVPPERSA